eukprot:5673765-Pyramimonas_sp.AAC.1
MLLHAFSIKEHSRMRCTGELTNAVSGTRAAPRLVESRPIEILPNNLLPTHVEQLWLMHLRKGWPVGRGVLELESLEKLHVPVLSALEEAGGNVRCLPRI